MATEKLKYFDLPILLKDDDLDMRRFAGEEPSVTVKDYFIMLADFLRLAPDVKNALDKFAVLNGWKDEYRSLDSMIKLLDYMGCKKFILDFHSLLDAYGKKGNWREAGVRAKQITPEFISLFTRIKEAQTSNQPHELPDVALSLNEYIRRLDEEAANRKLSILAVDDSPVVLKSVAYVLEDGYKVYTLIKPTELEKVLKKLTPDLFLLDYKMPEINGFDLVPIIRGFEEHKDTPIIFLTSEGTINNLTAAIGLGACDFAVKPFSPDVLREKIARHIIKKRSF